MTVLKPSRRAQIARQRDAQEWKCIPKYMTIMSIEVTTQDSSAVGFITWQKLILDSNK
jgi:hypothetical protein